MSIPASHLPRRDVPWGLLAFVPIAALGAAVLTLAAAPQTLARFLPHVLPHMRISLRGYHLHPPFHHAYPRSNSPAPQR
jgi:hypothetical protein